MTREERNRLRRAVANYMQSEGCCCCSDYEQHQLDRGVLAKLLRVPMYKDGSGYDFTRYRDAQPRVKRRSYG